MDESVYVCYEIHIYMVDLIVFGTFHFILMLMHKITYKFAILRKKRIARWLLNLKI